MRGCPGVGGVEGEKDCGSYQPSCLRYGQVEARPKELCTERRDGVLTFLEKIPGEEEGGPSEETNSKYLQT